MGWSRRPGPACGTVDTIDPGTLSRYFSSVPGAVSSRREPDSLAKILADIGPHPTLTGHRHRAKPHSRSRHTPHFDLRWIDANKPYERLLEDWRKWLFKNGEGDIPYMYCDNSEKALVTIGVGHLIDPIDEHAEIFGRMVHSETQKVATKDEIAAEYEKVSAAGKKLSTAEKQKTPASHYRDITSLRLKARADEELFQLDMKRFSQQLRKLFPGFDQFPAPAKVALFDMIFNLGIGHEKSKKQKATGLTQFHKLRAAISTHDWIKAAEASHRNGPGPERNEMTRLLFLAAAHVRSRRDMTQHSELPQRLS
jgi:hypothetical protein